MKIIDEKGRLFGKINIIDFFVVLFLLCILPAFYFGYKIMTKKPIELKRLKEIEVNCLFVQIKPELLPLILVGDKEIDENGQAIGEIVKLGDIDPYQCKFDIGKGQEIIEEDTLLKQMKTKLKLKVQAKTDNLYYKGTVIKIDSPFEFKTNKYNLNAMPIIGFGERISVLLTVKFTNLMPEISRIIKPGDEQRVNTKDDNRMINSKIKRIVSDEAAEFISLIPGEKQWTIVGHPKNRDKVLEIETSCTHMSEIGLYIGNKPLKIGSAFDFSPNLYSISGTVIDLKVK